MTATVVGVSAAALLAAACIAVAVRARTALRRLAPPGADALLALARAAAGEGASAPHVRSELEAERRSASATMGLLLLRFRAAGRVALASGTGSSVLVLADTLGQSSQSGFALASACFAAGGATAVLVAQLGHAARGERRRFHDDWNRQMDEAARRLGDSEWTTPGGAG